MRKSFKSVLLTLAVCAATFCCLGGFLPLFNKTQASATTAYYTLDNFFIEDGASVRTTDFKGIRFKTEVSDELQTYIEENLIAKPQYGTLLIPADLLDGELTHKTAKVLDIPTKEWNGNTYAAVLAGKYNADGTYNDLSTSYYSRPLAARSYVTGKDGDGNTVTYYTENTVERSLGYVAYLAKLDNNPSELLGEIADHTDTKVELSFKNDAVISAVQPNDGETAIVKNAYENTTTDPATVKIGGIELDAENLAKYGASVSYTTSDENVISVSGSTLTAVSKGEATITANVTFNGTKYTGTKTMSTSVFKPTSDYKILISEAAESTAVRKGTGYQPLKAEAYSTYYNAFEKTAAYKLQSILEEATGVRLEVVTEKVDGQKYISVGETALGSASALSEDVKAKDNASAVKVDTNGNVIIRGTTPRGTLFGVQELLQELVGYEYYMEYTYKVSPTNCVVLAGDTNYIPDIDHNVIQGSELNRVGALDEYSMQFYTEGIIPTGTLDTEDASGNYYRGIAHNSLLVIPAENFAVTAATAETNHTIKVGSIMSSTKVTLTKYNLYDGGGADATNLGFYDVDGVVETSEYKDWFATRTIRVTNYKKQTVGSYYKSNGELELQAYYVIDNPYYGRKDDPDTTDVDESKLDDPDTKINEMQATIKAELCYTAHGNTTERSKMVEAVATEMYNKMQKFPNLDRIGFSHMDHRYWCQCSVCTAQGNPSDNLLKFLLDVVPVLKAKLGNDARAETFKICSLFYHQTNMNPALTSISKDTLKTYMKHIEPWFAETGLDHVDPFDYDDPNREDGWNEIVYGYLKAWGALCKTYGADLLVWEYYQNTTSFFIPYDTVNAIRKNYAIFASEEIGVDYLFNQMMESKQTFARFKEYLMSKLAWNANPSQTVWDGWVNDYFAGAYGNGSTQMKNYYDAMAKWSSDNIEAFRADEGWRAEGLGWDQYGNTLASLGYDVRTSEMTGSSYFDSDTLTTWINYINDALDALDKNDPKYETYRRNIMLEKLTPMYLLMWVCDGYTPEYTWKRIIDPNTPGTFDSDPTYVKTYGKEFLAWVEEWNITQDGEGTARVLEPFLTAIQGVVGTTIDKITVNQYVTERRYIDVSETAKFSDGLLVDGTYTVGGALSGSVTATNGNVTLNASALTAGESYVINFTNSNGTITFTDVVAVKKLSPSASAGSVSGSKYYYIDKTYYIEEGKTQLTVNHEAFAAGQYTVTIAGVDSLVSVIKAGTLSLKIGELNNGDVREVVCVDESGNTIIVNVVCAKFIRTKADIDALGVGGYFNEPTPRVDAEGNPVLGENGKQIIDYPLTYNAKCGDSKQPGFDVKGVYVLAGDLDLGGAIIHPGHNYQQSNFIGVFDGNGYTISNFVVGDGGIFGGLKGATIKNVNFEGVTVNIRDYYPGWNYGALLANQATDTVIENVTASFAALKFNPGYNDPDNGGSTTKYHTGLFVANGSFNVVYSNVTADVRACENRLYQIFGSYIEKMSASNVKIYMTQSMYEWMQTSFGGVIYGYSDNKETAITSGVTGVSIITQTFEITTTATEVGVGNTLQIETNQAYSYTYTLKEAVEGVSVNASGLVSVEATAKRGTSFTVVVEANGCVRELTLTISKANLTIEDVPTIEVKEKEFTLPSGIEGDVEKITVGGFVYYDRLAATGKIANGKVTPAAWPVQQENLGKGVDMVIETTSAIYTGTANVYTMIINDVAEFDAWQEVAAQNAVDAGLCIAAQKGITYSGYFVLGNDIEYNKLFTSYKTYGQIWELCYSNANIWTGGANNSGSLVEGAFQEDWGRGEFAGFKGVLDGDGHKVIGLQTSGKYNAFIVTMAGGTVKDIAFTDAKIGSGASLIAARGAGCLENVYVQVSSMENGDTSSGDSITSVLFARGNQNLWVAGNEMVSKNVIVDVSAFDYASLKGAIISSLIGVHYENLYVVGANESVAESGEVGVTNAACLFVDLGGNGLDNKDVLGRFVDYSALLDGSEIETWNAPWNVTAKNEIYFGDYMIFDKVVTEELNDVVTIEQTNGSFTLPEQVTGNVTKVVVSGYEFTAINGKTVTIAENELVAQDQLGKGKEIVVYTDTKTYYGTANVYTMIIDDKAELDRWQEVASENAIEAGICIEQQKGFAYNGYFLLNADIEYNDVWMPYKAATNGGNQLWSLVYTWDAVAGAGVVRADLHDENGELLKGAIVEDWGKGEKGGFKGVFDGDGHYIEGMETTGEYNAFVVTMGGGTIKNVAFTGAKIGSKASLVANRGSGAFENIYVQVVAMESGANGSSTQVLRKMYNTHVSTAGMNNVLVDVSAIDFASLQWAYIANLGTVSNNIYVVGMPEGITLSATSEQAAPVAFLHCNPNAENVADYDDAGAFVDYKTLLNETNVEEWDGVWNVTEKNEIYFGDYMAYDGLDVVELDAVVEFSVEDGEFALPEGVQGTVKAVSLLGKQILVEAQDGVVTIDRDAIATAYDVHGEGKRLVITTDSVKYVLTATVITKVIKTTQELRDLGVGGMVYTDRTPTYSNSTETGAGGNANSGVAGNDKLGYYVLGNDLDFAGEQAVAAGYTWQQSWFKGIFDGNGYTIYNISVNEGGIFGSLRGATIKNVNFVGVVYNINLGIYAGQYSQQTALFAHVSDSSTFENISVDVGSVVPGTYVWATLAYTFWNTNTLTNINIDASGLALSSILGSDSQSKVSYSNVNVKAFSYDEIGKKGGVVLTEFPAGVTFTKVDESDYVIAGNGNIRPMYKGDVTALGFAAGTKVFELTSPATTNPWDGTMGNKSNQVLLTKGAGKDDYASIQFVLGKDYTNAGAAFWSWVHAEKDGNVVYAAGGYLNQDGSTTTAHNDDAKFNVTENGYSFAVVDANGNAVTSGNPLKAGVVYTLRVYGNHIVKIELAVYDSSNNAMTVYFANPSRGTSRLLYDTNKRVLPIYIGDVTKLGFEEGTTVQYKTDEYDLVGGSDNWWKSGSAVEINGEILDCSNNVKRQSDKPEFYADANYDVVCIEFALSEAVASGSVFHIWAYDENATHLGDGSVAIGQAWAESGFAGAIYDKDGNIATSLEANTVYVLKLRMDGAYRYNIANIAESAMTTYYSGDISYEN